MKATKPATKSAPRKPSAKPVRTPGKTGSLSRPETTKLVMQAQEAFHYQTVLGQIETGTKFDDWRRDQVLAAVGLPGISKLHRSHFRAVLAHFLTLSGRDDEAFDILNRTGQKRDHGDPDDTHEAAEALVALIREALASHALVPAASLQLGKGHIHAGWFIAAARQRTAKPTLGMDTLAERLDPVTLTGLLAHLRNHISRREVREDETRRKIRTYPKKPDAGSMHEDDPF